LLHTREGCAIRGLSKFSTSLGLVALRISNPKGPHNGTFSYTHTKKIKSKHPLPPLLSPQKTRDVNRRVVI